MKKLKGFTIKSLFVNGIQFEKKVGSYNEAIIEVNNKNSLYYLWIIC